MKNDSCLSYKGTSDQEFLNVVNTAIKNSFEEKVIAYWQFFNYEMAIQKISEEDIVGLKNKAKQAFMSLGYKVECSVFYGMSCTTYTFFVSWKQSWWQKVLSFFYKNFYRP